MADRDEFTEDREEDYDRPGSRRRPDDEDRPRNRRDRDEEPPPSSGWKIALIISGVVLLLFCVISGVAVGLLLPAVQKVREAAARMSSQNNLKQIGIAFHSASDATNKVPPSVGPFPAPGFGGKDTFFFHILPYLEQDNVYRARAMNASIKTYLAPTDATATPGSNLISYATNHAVCGTAPWPIFQLHAKGESNTIVVTERFSVTSGQPHAWSDTGDLITWISGPRSGLEFGKTGPDASADAAHALTGTVCQMLLADGAVRTMSKGDEAPFRWACDPKQIGIEPRRDGERVYLTRECTPRP
jgi:hypothetical protein